MSEGSNAYLDAFETGSELRVDELGVGQINPGNRFSFEKGMLLTLAAGAKECPARMIISKSTERNQCLGINGRHLGGQMTGCS